MRVLIAEDEPMLAELIAEGLRGEALAVDVVNDGRAALDHLSVYDYDVLVLDRDLPKVHGDDVCRQVTGGTVKVIMLTASSDVKARVEGLRLGADDYLPKPFAFDELVARIQALGRRTGSASVPVFERAGITLDPGRRQVFRDGEYLSLANKEFGILAELLRADGAIVSAEHLLEKVWDAHTDPFTNTVRVTMMKLRKKLGDPPVIVTVPGAGYQIP